MARIYISRFAQFVEDEQYHRNMKLTLESKENRKLNVVFMPVVADQAMNGKIVILRRQNLDLSSDEIQKRVVSRDRKL